MWTSIACKNIIDLGYTYPDYQSTEPLASRITRLYGPFGGRFPPNGVIPSANEANTEFPKEVNERGPTRYVRWSKTALLRRLMMSHSPFQSCPKLRNQPVWDSWIYHLSWSVSP
jgi:hypothetical protein